MSTEDDTELRDLVTQTLEVNGCLAKIRAQLRASVFLALDENEEVHKQEPMLNKKIKTCLQTQEGRTMFCLVREFLEYFNLDFTISVFEPESYMGAGYKYEGRHKIIENLGITPLEEYSTAPLLLQLMRIAQLKTNTNKTNININLSKIQNGDYSNMNDKHVNENNSINENDSTHSVSERNDTRKEDKRTSNTSVCEQLEQLTDTNSFESQLSNKSVENLVPPNNHLNETFNVSTPSVEVKGNNTPSKLAAFDLKNNNSEAQLDTKSNEDKSQTSNKPVEVLTSPRSLASTKSNEEKDDTYEGTSSLVEDSVKDQELSEKDKSLKQIESRQFDSEKSHKSAGEPTESEFSPPILKDTKSHSKFDASFEKLKLSPQKAEKLKNKTSLSSLSDLPPLPLNKSRNDSLLLPSLYSKEFRDKCNPKEVDKFPGVDLDSLDNYEEDFMSNSELVMSHNKSDFLTSESSKINLLEELQQANSKPPNVKNSPVTQRNANLHSTNFLDSNKIDGKLMRPSRFSESSNKYNLDHRNPLKERNSETKPDLTHEKIKKVESPVSSTNSDDLELGSNVDDILNSK